MRRAVELAAQGWGETHPNPMVGALVVRGREIVGEGYHERAGEAHAEVNALREAGPRARGATLYVTLEPCSTHGRTPPCNDAIIEAGIERVVIGALDPNPLHEGRGLRALQQAGITVTTGILRDECSDLNLIFNHWITTGQPMIAAKVATSIDGLIATHAGDSRWITGEAARSDVHRWRRYFPAIAIGANTVLKDNPRLTVRTPARKVWCPRRFVFDRGLRTVTDPLPQLYQDAFANRTTVVSCDSAQQDAEKLLEDRGVTVWRFPDGAQSDFFQAFLQRCKVESIYGIYVEGGSNLLSALLNEGMIHYLFAYRAPLLLADSGGLPAFGGEGTELVQQAWRLSNVRLENFGNDQLMRGWLRKAV